MPIFSRIKYGVLDLTGYRVYPELLDALAGYIKDIIDEQKAKDMKEEEMTYVKHLVMDSNEVRDA